MFQKFVEVFRVEWLSNRDFRVEFSFKLWRAALCKLILGVRYVVYQNTEVEFLLTSMRFLICEYRNTLRRKCESVGTLADAELVDGLHEELIDGAAS